MRVKEWKYDQIMKDVCRYGDLWMYLDVKRSGELDEPEVKDGYVEFTCRATILRETAKAVFVELGDKWKTWIPKSAIGE